MPKLQKLNTEPRTRADFAARITATYLRALDALFVVGKQLLEAKATLPHGDFIKMCRRDLPFRERQAQRLMQIARHPVLSNPRWRDRQIRDFLT